MEPILPYKYSKFLFFSSFSMLIATIISYITNDIYITLYFFILFLTSINHWRRPEYGLRRDIDLFIVKVGFFTILWQICLLKSEFTRYCVLCLSFCSFVFYFIEHVLEYYNNIRWIILHMAIHMYMSFTIFIVLIDVM